MAVYITGDIHGFFRLKRILPQNLNFCQPGDTIIVAGDFGLIFKENDIKIEQKYLKILDSMNINICFIDGDRENHRRLSQYPRIYWNGGRVGKIKDNIFHLLRGEIYTIEDIKILCMGGATTPIQTELIVDYSWWPNEEIISQKDINNALFSLRKNQNQVDYVITHTCPSSVGELIVENDLDEIMIKDCCCKSLEYLKEVVNCKHWYFGHFHKDIKLNDQFTCIFQKIIKL